MKLGVVGESLKCGVAESIERAAALGLAGIQLNAASGEFAPEALSAEDIRRTRRLLRDAGLALSALCGDLGGHGFEIAADNPARIEKTERIIDLAAALETAAVTTHIGVIPADTADPRYGVMLDALGRCGAYAHARGVTLAIETGPEIAPVLDRFVRAAGDGVGVNLDPANFVMVTGQDPAAAVRLLRERIVHTHLKDGRMLRRSDPVEVYRCFAEGGIDALNVADYFLETPVGEGQVDFAAYLAALREVGFNGFLTIERETGADPAADIRTAADYIRTHHAAFLD